MNGAQTTTGYGQQGRKMLKMFQELGHTVANQAFYGVQGGMLEIEGIPHYCNLRSMWSEDVIRQTVEHFKADAVLTLFDLWVLQGNYQQQAGVPHIAYFPVDSIPVNPATVQRAREARFPVVYSKFGLAEMEKAGVRCDYVPHAIDCEVFKPGDQAAAREHLGLPTDAYLVSLVGANKGFPSRKAFPEQLAAFAEFRKKHSDAILFLHTQKRPIGSWSDGIYFDGLLQNLGLHDKGCVYFSNEYLSSQGMFTEEDVAKVYQASDMVLHATCAEGFGLCSVEAQACGAPVVTTDCSSMTELTFNGIATKPLGRSWSLLNCWQWLVDPKAVLEAMEEIWQGARTPKDESHEWVKANYACDVVRGQYWRPLLQKIEAELSEIKGVYSAAAD